MKRQPDPRRPPRRNSVLLVLPRRAFRGPQAVPHLCVHQRPNEDKHGAQPVPQGERVLEVQDGDDEAHELAQGHDEGDGEGGALRGEDEDAPDAHVPGEAGLRGFLRSKCREETLPVWLVA